MKIMVELSGPFGNPYIYMAKCRLERKLFVGFGEYPSAATARLFSQLFPDEKLSGKRKKKVMR